MRLLKSFLFAGILVLLSSLDLSAQCVLCPPGDGGGGIPIKDPILDPGDGGSGGGGTPPAAVTPTANQESLNNTTSFMAHWSHIPTATKYYVDVAYNSSFSSYVPGYQNKVIEGASGTIEQPIGIVDPGGENSVPNYLIVDGLTPGRKYYYRVRSQNIAGSISSNSNTITANTLINAPTGLEESGRGSTKFTARWTSSGVNTYLLYVSTKSGDFDGSHTVSGYNGKTVSGTSHVVTGLAQGKNYYYKIKAKGVHYTSGFSSNQITAHTSIPAPTATEESSRTNSSFRANWNSVTGATQYYLYVSTKSGDFDGSHMVSGYNGKTITGTNATVSGLQPGKNYYYKVKSRGPHKTSGFSNQITANTSISAPTIAAESQRTTSKFTANWSSVGGAVSYLLYVSDKSGDYSSTHVLSNYNGKSITGTSAIVDGLIAGKNYYYKVKAKGPHKTSGFSGQESAYTGIDFPLLLSESGVSTTGFTINWGLTQGAESFLVYVTAKDGDYGTSHIVPGFNGKSVITTNVKVTGLQPGRTYYYKVKTVGEDRHSGFTHQRAFSTNINAPTATSASSRSTSGFTANWGAVPGAESYKLYVSTKSGDFDGSHIVSGYNGKPIMGTAAAVNNLEGGTYYYYKVQAVGGDVSSSLSNQITTSTLLETPTALQADNLTQTSFQAHWTAVSGANNYTLQVSEHSDFSIVLQNALILQGVNSGVVGNLTYGKTYYYRVKAFGDATETGYSNTITVLPLVVPGEIQYTGEVCAGDSPGEITGDLPTGGNGSYEYRWQYHNGTQWQTLVEGPEYRNYTPSINISSNTKFRRRVRSGSSGWKGAYELTVNIYDVIEDIGTLSATGSTICPGEYLEFTYAAAAGVNKNKTRLIGVKNETEVDFGVIKTKKSINVQKGYNYFVRYTQQQCTPEKYTSNNVSFSFYENCNVPPSFDQNFVRTEVPKVPVKSQYELSVLGATEKSTSYAYSDGLGRPTMSVAVQAGEDFEDVIQFSEYNSKGQKEYSYLPYMDVKVVPGKYIDPATAKVEQGEFYNAPDSDYDDIGHDTKAYSRTQWDARGRVKSVIAPGAAWHNGNKKTTYDYAVFDPSLAGSDASSIHAPVLKWKIENGLPVRDGTYAAKELSVSSVTDVEGRKSRKVTDVKGLAITSQIYDQDQNKWVGSYNVYDGFGRVRFIISPRLSEISTPTSDQVKELGFQYQYDNKGRVIRERAPGAGWVSYVYDRWNRLVLTRHQEQYLKMGAGPYPTEKGYKTWTFFKYDALNRQIMTGEVYEERSRGEMQAFLDDPTSVDPNNNDGRYETVVSTSSRGYTKWRSFPDLNSDYSIYQFHTVNYFDNYDFLTFNNWDAEGHDFSLSIIEGFDNFGWAPTDYTLLTEDREIIDHRIVLPGGTPPTGTVEHNGKYAVRPGVQVTMGENVVPGPEFSVVNASQPYTNVVGKSTGSKVRILGTNIWLNTVVYYDERGRVIQTISENHKNGLDRLTNDLDWKGELQKMMVQHHSEHENVGILSEYEYTHNGQLVKTWQTLGEIVTPPPAGTLPPPPSGAAPGGESDFTWGFESEPLWISQDDRILVGEYHYNILGELVEKNLHSENNGNSFLQSVDYRYNIRGAMTRINDADLGDGEDDLFGMEYHYETSLNINGTDTEPRFDGMVSAMAWNADNIIGSGSDFSQTGIGFTYDKQSRLKSTAYGTGASYNDAATANAFSMAVDEYDDNGNIKSLRRNADGEEIDQLSYFYKDHSNKLKGVDDASTSENSAIGLNEAMTSNDIVTEYTYDDMGNMIEDDNKKIQKITYNHFQLVESIEFTDGTQVVYTYDATRNRLAKEVRDTDDNTIARVDYVGLVEYLDDEINQVFTDEGRAYKQNDAFHYEYFITDHQGNNRVAFGNLPDRNVYTATMELNREAYEESHFKFPNDAIRSDLENHTPLGEGSIALNGANTLKRLGPAKVLTIAPGDEVAIEVWAKYNNAFTDDTPINDIVSAIASAFGTAGVGTPAEGAGSAISDAFAIPSNALFASANDTETRAYLQYMFFNENHEFQEAGSSFKEVTNASLGKFAKYESGTVTYNEPGYLFIYLVNESATDEDVYFDDLKITHSSATASFKVSQVNDFYPFGLPTSNSWRSPGYIDPGLLYQSSYASYDSLTGYYDFLSRSYDPVLGRFFAVDPAGQFSSPYAGMGNIPHFGTDPDGEFFFAAVAIGALIGGTVSGIQTANNGGTFFGGFWKGALVGGLTTAVTMGVASGMNVGLTVAKAGGSFGAGFNMGINAFMQGAQVVSATGIAAGATVGAASGLAGGFTGGFVNGIANGESFVSAIGSAWDGAKGGFLSGGIIGGISGGISAFKRNEKLWSGDLRDDVLDHYDGTWHEGVQETYNLEDRDYAYYDEVAAKKAKSGSSTAPYLETPEMRSLQAPDRYQIVRTQDGSVFLDPQPGGSFSIKYNAKREIAKLKDGRFWRKITDIHRTDQYSGTSWLSKLFEYRNINVSTHGQFVGGLSKFGYQPRYKHLFRPIPGRRAN